MTASVNKVTLVGTLEGAPMVRIVRDGSAVVSFYLRTVDEWTDRKSGVLRTRAERHRVVIFNPKLAAVARERLGNGGRAYVEGTLLTRQWKDEADRPRLSIEIVLDHDRGELVPLDRLPTPAAA